MKIALATSRETPDKLDGDDDLLLKGLAAHNILYKILVWGNGVNGVNGVNAVDNFNNYDLTLIRSTWDYYKQPVEFLDWVNSVKLINNPYNVVQWNIDKSYLLELHSQAGVKIIPTIKVDSATNLLQTLQQQLWPNAIVKPCISLGSLDTEIIVDYDTTKAQALLVRQPTRQFMLQPFIEEIRTRGEISIIFIAGQYSHAVRKVPKSGDFRAQPEFGSQVTNYQVNTCYMTICNNILDYIRRKFGSLLYARIDFIDCEEPLLLELELIEPCLYFKYHPAAVDNLITQIKLLC